MPRADCGGANAEISHGCDERGLAAAVGGTANPGDEESLFVKPRIGGVVHQASRLSVHRQPCLQPRSRPPVSVIGTRLRAQF